MSNYSELLVEMVGANETVEVGEDTLTAIKEVGTLPAEAVANAVITLIHAENVTYVPGLMTNLLSVICLHRKCLSVAFNCDSDNSERGVVLISKGMGGSVLAKGFERKFGLYELLIRPVSKYFSRATVATTGKIGT